MNLEKIKQKIKSEEYDFLRNDEHLGKNVILLCLGGSYAYGVNRTDGSSDIDLRGISLNSKKEILLSTDFEQVIDNQTDSTIYSFNKMIQLLTSNNPNTIEQMGCLPEHYLYLSSIGKELLDNKQIFLSKKAAFSFGGYATAQARRLDNKAVRLVNQEQREKHILNSIMNAYYTFPDKYFPFSESDIKLYIDKSEQEDYDTEIFMDVNLKHYPLRDYKAMWSEMNNIVKDYSKFGKRNRNAIEHNKLGKHMCHLIRLYYMCFDILENKQIITYREKEHDLLMDLRNGKYLDKNKQPIPEFYEMVDELEKRLEYDKEHTDLPDIPDYKRIEEFKISVNERIVRGDI